MRDIITGLIVGGVLLLLAVQLRWWRLQPRPGSNMRMRVKGKEYKIERRQ